MTRTREGLRTIEERSTRAGKGGRCRASSGRTRPTTSSPSGASRSAKEVDGTVKLIDIVAQGDRGAHDDGRLGVAGSRSYNPAKEREDAEAARLPVRGARRIPWRAEAMDLKGKAARECRGGAWRYRRGWAWLRHRRGRGRRDPRRKRKGAGQPRAPRAAHAGQPLLPRVGEQAGHRTGRANRRAVGPARARRFDPRGHPGSAAFHGWGHASSPSDPHRRRARLFQSRLPLGASQRTRLQRSRCARARRPATGAQLRPRRGFPLQQQRLRPAFHRHRAGYGQEPGRVRARGHLRAPGHGREPLPARSHRCRSR